VSWPEVGPYRVITDLAILGFHDETRRMEVLSLHPGVTLEDVQQNTGFEIGAANELTGTEPPGERELAVLREDVDPHGYVIGR